jgi:hypothetical protein
MLAMSTSPASAGASSCASAATTSAATASIVAAVVFPCSPEQQGAGAPFAPRVLRQWGLGFDSQRLPPPCPTRLRCPDQRAP